MQSDRSNRQCNDIGLGPDIRPRSHNSFRRQDGTKCGHPVQLPANPSTRYVSAGQRPVSAFDPVKPVLLLLHLERLPFSPLRGQVVSPISPKALKPAKGCYSQLHCPRSATIYLIKPCSDIDSQAITTCLPDIVIRQLDTHREIPF